MSFNWIGVWFWPLLGVAVVVPVSVIIYGRRKVKPQALWLKDIVVPVMTSLVVALVGIGFAIESARRQHDDVESDRQTSLMGGLMVSQDRRDTAYLLSLDLNLNIHLNRYKQMIGAKNKPPDEDILFEEEAIFFFYSKHRAALVNLRSSEGSLVFRRLWMENVFEQLSIHVVESVLGGLSERNPGVSAQGESATYKFFGAKTHSESETSDEPKKPESQRLGGQPMVLADFDALLHDRSRFFDPRDEDVRRIKREFEGFQERLHNADQKPPTAPSINRDELITSLLAMQGLVAYSYQNLFSVWYGLDEEEIPKDAKDLRETTIPKHFLNLMWYDFEPSLPQMERKEMWAKKRQEAWKLIFKFRPRES